MVNYNGLSPGRGLQEVEGVGRGQVVIKERVIHSMKQRFQESSSDLHFHLLSCGESLGPGPVVESLFSCNLKIFPTLCFANVVPNAGDPLLPSAKKLKLHL